MHDGTGFLALRPRNPVALVRRLPEQQLTALPETFTPPLRVLLVTARPDDAGFIDPRGIARSLYEAVEDQMASGELLIEFLRPPTLPALVARLNDPDQPPVHILHFDGHGTFVTNAPPTVPTDGVRLATSGMGALAFENDAGGMHIVDASALANLLGQSGVKLAVLTACQSAVSATDDAFSSVAGRLIKGGVDSVIAMSASLLVVTATKYVQTFYASLARNTPLLRAHSQASQQLAADPARHVLQRTKDQPGAPVTLHDWWLPHFYQQRPFAFVLGTPTQAAPLPVALRTLSKFPDPPRYGFGGRAREMLDLERDLRKGKLVLIHGFGGQGKTTLACEAADWLTRTGMYRGALFVALDTSAGGASWLLAELGRHLDCDGSFNPDDHAAALADLRPLLTTRRTLVVLDNLETVLPRGDAPLPAAELQALWNAVLTLRQHGAGLLLTTRDTELGDVRLQPGQHVRHLTLRGLSEADAYALASRLLEAHGIALARAPYPELMQLLAQLGYHPHALELVLPVLASEPMGRVLQEFSALLGRFMDAAVPGRNQSLLASLDYSLRRLSTAHRALLPRLAPFEGGAMEPELLAITEIPEAEWRDLRRALEQAALISAEQLPGIKPPFLRFHPVLAPALREQPSADPGMPGRYPTRYAGLAKGLYFEDQRDPLPIRALVRREMPNLRRAFAHLRAQGNHETAVVMAEHIAWFLTVFGLGRELVKLRTYQQQSADLLATTGDGTLSNAEYLHESGQGEDEYNRGDFRAAYARLAALLARIEQAPPSAARGPDSYEHCLTLGRLARCLLAGGQSGMAEQALCRALAVIDALIVAQPENQQRIRQRSVLLTGMGNVLTDQGKYAEARQTYEDALKGDKQTDDSREQGVTLGELGTLALRQRDYAEATKRYHEALELFQTMHESAMEAVAWHQLGMVAEEQQQWVEAGRCYRESLVLKERQGDQAGAARTCNQLAIVAKGAGRSIEAEGWYERAMAIAKRIGDEKGLASRLNNLANLLANEIRAGRMGSERLSEARGYAERALAIRETLDAASEIWKTLNILADLADLEGQTVQAVAYRRREREAFAAFPGNRWHIDQQHDVLIQSIAAAARGDSAARATVEKALPQLEENGWRITDATRRLWAGERDWHSLCEGITANSALLILRVLESINA